MLLSLLLLTSPPPEIAARATELEARARAHHEAREYVQAANAYVALSSLPGVDVDDALGRAHLDLEAAFTATQDATHMCRALRLARGRLARGTGDEQMRLFWEETVTEDLEQLAEFGGEKVCPTAPVQRVGVLVAESTPETTQPTPSVESIAIGADVPPRSPERRLRARRAAGFAITGLGAGLATLMSVALAGYSRGYRIIKAAGDKPEGFVYTEDEEAALRDVRADTQMLGGLAVGLGVASGTALAAGIGLLATQRRAERRLALLPSNVPRGGGLAVRVRF